MSRPIVERTHSVRDWLDSIFTLAELLSLTEDELCELEELDDDIALTAAWWRRRRAKEGGPVRRVKRRLSRQDLRTLGVRPGLVATRYTPDTEEGLEERGTA